MGGKRRVRTDEQVSRPGLPVWQPTEPFAAWSVEPLESLPGGLIITDGQGLIQEADHAAGVLLQTSQHRMAGRRLDSFVVPESQADFTARLERAQQWGKVYEWKTTFHQRKGKPLQAEVTVTAAPDPKAGATRLRWLIRNISEHDPELVLQKAHQELEQRMREHTRQLIVANQKLADEIEQRKNAENALRKTHESLEKRVHKRTAELAIANEMLQNELAERRRAQDAAARRTHQLAALHEATAALLTTLDLETLLGQILDAATGAIPAAQKGMLHLVARDTGQLEMRAFIGYTNPRIRKLSVQSSKGYMARAVNTRKPLLIDNLQKDPENRGNRRFPDGVSARSVIVAPLLLENQALGAISLDSSEESAFVDDDLRLLVTFAATATAAIRNAQLHAEVQKLAITDSLTNLYNRRGFFELGRREVERARRFGRPLSAIMVDIDLFKEVNDTYGHSAGDQVLRLVAQRIEEITREVDILGRYGGDEFAILLSETDLATACSLANRLRDLITGESVAAGETLINISVSLGVAHATTDTQDLTDLLDRADAALYAAKQAGRNRVEVAAGSKGAG